MEITVNDLAERINGKASSASSVVISGAAGLLEAGPGDVTLLKDPRKKSLLSQLDKTKAGAVIVPKGTPAGSNGKIFIEVDNPIKAFSLVLGIIEAEKKPLKNGVHPSSVIAEGATVDEKAFVGPHCVIEKGAVIGRGAQLLAQVYVGPGSTVGEGSLLYPQVVIREGVQVGRRCILHAGVVLGADGFGFFFDQGRHNKIPQVGGVIVEDDVEIGAGSTIDRATTGNTIIRQGAKIDNLVQVAHNVDIGEHAILVAQVGIAGSTKIGTGAVLAGQVGVADHVTVGAGAQVGAQSGIKDDIPEKGIYFGTPAQPIQDTIKQSLLLRKLPDLFKMVKKLNPKGK